MRVMVTGGRGFIGKHLVKQLEKLGHTVSVVDFRGNQLWTLGFSQVRVRGSYSEAKCDCASCRKEVW